MIDYTLAKRLKESGFPMKVRSLDLIEIDSAKLAGINLPDDAEEITVPTLSELIEECRKELDEIVIYIIDDLVEVKGVNPTYGWDLVVQGSTPDIAVANLYLALNEKK